MAFYSGSQTNAAGSLVTILDAQLVNNANWTIDDTPATNERVYRCSKEGAEVCLHVADNQSGYATMTMWEDWDADTSTGVGLYSTSTDIYWRKTTGTYWVILHDEYFIYVCFGTNLNYGHFFGNLDRFCPQYNTPILIGIRHTTVTGSNPLGQVVHTATGAACVCLDFERYQYLACYGEYAETTPSAINGYMGMLYRTTGDVNKVFLEETWVVNSQGNLLGVLPGVFAVGSTPTGMAHGDTVTDDNSDTWEMVYAGFGCLLRKT